MSNTAITAQIANLPTSSVRRLVHAVWNTPGRPSSKATADAKADRLVAEADAAWEVWHTERYGEPPTPEQRKYRRIASRIDWSFPVLGIGAPGTGKTSMGEGWAAALGLLPHTIIGSQQQPEEIGGYPVPTADRSSITKLPAPWVDHVSSAINGSVLLFDELPCSDEDMEAAMLRVFSDRSAGERRLTGRVRVMAFGNAPGQVAKARDLTSASANRFCHLAWDGPTKEEWLGWVSRSMDRDLISAIADENGDFDEPQAADPNAEEMRVLKAWPAALARAKALMSAAVGSGAVQLHSLPEQTCPQHSKGWASHRSNELAIRAMATSIVHNLTDEETMALLAGLIGPDEAQHLAEYLAKEDVPDPLAALDDAPWKTRGEAGKTQKPWRPDHRLDITMIVLEETSQLLAAHPHSKLTGADQQLWAKRASHWWHLADCAAKQGHADAIMVPVHPVIKIGGYGPSVCPNMTTLMRDMMPMIAKAGEITRR